MIKISSVCLWVRVSGLFAWEVDGPGIINLRWTVMKIIKYAVENCYRNITYKKERSLAAWVTMRACHWKPSIAQLVPVADTKWAEVFILLPWIQDFTRRRLLAVPAFAFCGQNDLGKKIYRDIYVSPQSTNPCTTYHLGTAVKMEREAEHPWN